MRKSNGFESDELYTVIDEELCAEVDEVASSLLTDFFVHMVQRLWYWF